MQKLLPLFMVSCFALGSCKGVRLGAAGIDAGGGSGGSSGNTGGVTGTGGASGTGRCPAGETLCSGCGSYSFCTAVCPTINCAVDAGSAGGAGGGGGTTGATGGTTSFSCANVGCSQPPLCSEGCTAPCGCCFCAVGERRGDLICTKSGCYASAVAPDAAGPDQAVDAPQADAGQAGAGGNGGTTGATGGTASFSCANVGCSQPPLCSEGCTAPCGCCPCSPGARSGDLICTMNGCYAPAVAPDAGGPDQAVDASQAASSCENPLPLKCGDRLYHNTLIQGRPNVLGFYGCSERVMSGPETIYFLAPPAGCQATVQLKNRSADLYVFVLPTCSFMSSCSFIPEVGQPSFVVVDGANGAWGTYTLEVDCTCSQDGGTSDLPDAQGGTATAPGCDLDVAWKAIAAAGLSAVGTPQTLNVTLPATLPTDANWGLKATVCQEGGYDITALAGKPICLVEQDITQWCQGNPASVSVLMNNGAVACIYETVRKGFGAPPGVYSATSPNCTQPKIAAGASVSCGRSFCQSPWPCCSRLTTVNLAEICGLRCPAPITCDGPNDCSNGNVCCSLESAADGFLGTSCVNPSECVAPSRVICSLQADCPSPQQCVVPNPMPAYVPEDYDPTLPPYSWMVYFQVCAP